MNEPCDDRAPAGRQAAMPRWQLALGLLFVAGAAIGGVALGQWLRSRRAPEPKHRPSPVPEADPIWDAWRAAERGDVAAHLACFAPPELERLQAELEAKGTEALRQRLRQMDAAARSLDLFPQGLRRENLRGFRVEVGHDTETELFDYLVVRDGEAWRISRITPRGTRANAPPAPPAEQGDPR